MRCKKPQDQVAFADAAPTRGGRIALMGIFKAVEAFGLPIKELRRRLGALFLPLNFDNMYCAASAQPQHPISPASPKAIVAPLRR